MRMKKLLLFLLIFCLLLPSALAATTFAPKTASEGKLLALDCLQYSSFGAEYNSTNNYLKRWEEEIRIYAYGSPTNSDLATLDHFIMQLSFRCPFLPPIKRVNSESSANVTIYFGPLETLGNHINGYVKNNWGFFTYTYSNSGYNIYRGKIAIASDVTKQKQRNHLIMEELVGVLGMANDHELYSDSIVYAPWTETQQLSDIDWLMLNMLYHPSLSCGMTYKQARNILLNTF